MAALVALATGVALHGLTRIEFDDVPREIFASGDEEYARLLSVYADFGSDDNDVLLVFEGSDWFRPESAALLRRAAERCARLDDVDSVTWFGGIPVFAGPGSLLPRALLDVSDDELEAARARARTHPLVRGRLLSDDGRVALMLVRLRDGLDGIAQIEPAVDELRALAAGWGRRMDGEKEGASEGRPRVGVTGIPPIRVDIYETIQGDQVRFFLIGSVLCLALSLYLFRSVGAVVCTTVPPLVASVWAYGFIGLAGGRLDILSGVLSVLVIVIALTDSVHLMIDVRISRAHGAGRVEAAVRAIRHLGLPCALTSLTTAIGFGSLTLASVPAIRRFGVLAAGSVVVAFFAVITIMPLLASVFARVGASRADRETGSWGRRAGPVIAFVVARARSIAVLGAAATAGLFALSMQLVPENRLTEALPHDEAYRALMVAEEAFGGVLPTYVLVDWERSPALEVEAVLDVVGEVSDFLSGVDGIGRPLSVLDVLDAVPGARTSPAAALAILPEEVTRRVARFDVQRTLVFAQMPDEGSHVLNPLFARIRDGLRAIGARHPEVDLHLTGTDVVARSNVNRMIDDLARSLAFAALIIFGVIALEFRSLRIGAISLLPNLFPLVLVGGALRLFDRPLQMGSAVLFTVLLGLAVDDTIHFLARYRREAARRSPKGSPASVGPPGAIEAAFLAVGRAILITTCVLGTGFLTVGLSDVPTNRLFAWLSCLGLGGALIGDLLVLPALLVLAERRRARRAAS